MDMVHFTFFFIFYIGKHSRTICFHVFFFFSIVEFVIEKFFQGQLGPWLRHLHPSERHRLSRQANLVNPGEEKLDVFWIFLFFLFVCLNCFFLTNFLHRVVSVV